jgi:long-chain acyl-CoA synthetase
MHAPPPFSSLVEFVEGLARTAPDRAAIRCGDRVWTRGGLVRQSRALAAGWCAAGCEPGAVVGIVGETGPAFVLAFLSAARAGLVPLLLDPRLTTDELAIVLPRARPRALALCGGATLPAAHDLPRLVFDASGCAELGGLANQSALRGGLANQPALRGGLANQSALRTAVMLVTSGTSGAPRVVALSASNLSANITSGAQAHPGSGTPEVFLSLLPLTHAFELTMGVLGPLWCGASVVFPESRNPRQLLKTMISAGVTHLNVVPAVLYMIASEVRESAGLSALRPLFGQLRSIVCGGAPLAPELVSLMTGFGVPLWLGYGLTEASPSVAVGRADSLPPGSTGRALPGVELRVEAETGELLVRGPNVMLGYVGDPDATAETISNGWLRTGDVVRLDADGNVFILGRRRDTIVTGSGLKLLPDDVESAYRSPLFAECCAIGVPDPGGADRPHLVVVGAGSAAPREIEAEFRRLSMTAGTRQAFGLTIWSTPLPRTRTLKVRRALVRQAVVDELSRIQRGARHAS